MQASKEQLRSSILVLEDVLADRKVLETIWEHAHKAYVYHDENLHTAYLTGVVNWLYSELSKEEEI